ncbi:hypothetical protein C2845_PM05G14510 [Panicum miliaceum]|uniref:Uncharacterized protein n=1 Tax=Panicum miliaceum TaxID=4540 RepID=A0A3L6SU84_PANMI|nr:hypothetical protein C2845_PM05G14510 [Panicum miliaceum]
MDHTMITQENQENNSEPTLIPVDKTDSSVTETETVVVEEYDMADPWMEAGLIGEHLGTLDKRPAQDDVVDSSVRTESGTSEMEIVVVEEWSEADDLMEGELSIETTKTQKEGPAQAQVFSRRIQRSGLSVLETAEARQAKKNLENSGNVSTDLENISLLKAKELAQAAIRMANEQKKLRSEQSNLGAEQAVEEIENPAKETISWKLLRSEKNRERAELMIAELGQAAGLRV